MDSNYTNLACKELRSLMWEAQSKDMQMIQAQSLCVSHMACKKRNKSASDTSSHWWLQEASVSVIQSQRKGAVVEMTPSIIYHPCPVK